MYDLVIIGAGASGMAAALSAKKENPKAKVLILEALPRVGKKILATGNGRCNLTNFSATPESYGNPFVASVIKQYPPEKIVSFFSSIGLESVSDSESRVYPMSNMASSVLDCLRFEIERLGIEVLTETKAESVKSVNGIFIINSKMRTKKLIVSAGGKASPSQGSDGSGYELLRSLGHRITPLYAGLVQLTVKENLRTLKGIRVKAGVTLKNKSGKALDSSSGEILFADYGLSGIAVMDISRSVKNENCICELNVLPELSAADVYTFIERSKKRNPSQSAEDALTGIIPRMLGHYLIKMVGLSADIRLSELKEQQIHSLADKLKHLTFNVTGTKGFDNAQITVGGAEVTEFNEATLESRKVRGLYCTGEILDVDAPCGGFNLQWAWASGIAAGTAAAKSL
ncbi:MAG: aminoacetone oxidase family FAD-binding enzyme [Clostridia bacterium]|nr:aminoacetone oxidase family FAD-binding enzyme [Clostridia bacterium]